MNVSQSGVGHLLVSWTPSDGADVTGYYIYYLYSGKIYSATAEANDTSANITGVIASVVYVYSINVVANSTTLPSTEATAQDIILGIQ